MEKKNTMYKRGRRWCHSNNKNGVQNSNQMSFENQVYTGVALAVLVLLELLHLLLSCADFKPAVTSPLICRSYYSAFKWARVYEKNPPVVFTTSMTFISQWMMRNIVQLAEFFFEISSCLREMLSIACSSPFCNIL